MADPRDTATVSITLHQGRDSVSIGKYSFPTREGAIIAAVIDKFVRNILESKCPNLDD